MQRLEVSCAVRHIYVSLGAKGLKPDDRPGNVVGDPQRPNEASDRCWSVVMLKARPALQIHPFGPRGVTEYR